MWPLTQGRQSAFFPGAAVAHRPLGGIRNQGGRESSGEASGMSSPASALGLGHDPVYMTHT